MPSMALSQFSFTKICRRVSDLHGRGFLVLRLQNGTRTGRDSGGSVDLALLVGVPEAADLGAQTVDHAQLLIRLAVDGDALAA